jgi:hypothetical protein
VPAQRFNGAGFCAGTFPVKRQIARVTAARGDDNECFIK